MNDKIYDLRSAIEYLKEIPGQYVQCDKEIDPCGEITGLYHKIGARGTTVRPTKTGPMLMCSNVKGYKAPVCVGMLCDRERIGLLLGTEPDKLGRFFLDSMNRAVAPAVVDGDKALCQEEVYLADDPDFDIRNIIPNVFTTPGDGASFITMGLLYGSDPDNKESFNATIHRVGIQGKDTLTVGFGGHRHIGVFKDKALKRGEPYPVSISIGMDPAIYLASCFEPPTTPLGYDELQIAGGMRGKPVELAKCKTIDAYAIANAEYVIEGEFIPDMMVSEDSVTGTGVALPEFHGYGNKTRKSPGFKVKAVTCRHNPVYQICMGASDEHVNMAGLPSEASVLSFLDKALPGLVQNVYCPPSGGGKLNMIMQVKKRSLKDEGNQRQAALSVFAVLPECKNVIVVDEDIDIFDPYDVEWALTTRFRNDKGIINIPGLRCHIGDPVEKQFYDPSLQDNGIAHKSIYDATVPFELKDKLKRVNYMDVDIENFLEV